MTEWFEEWFTEEYLHLYPHRDEEEAARLVRLLTRVLPWEPGWRVLDVGCGAGRHARALAAAGARSVGLDLSAGLLARAREVTDGPLVRADMRQLPVRPGSMDLTVNLFTSFGYFASDDQHRAALFEMLASVRPGGWFVLDFLNADQVRADLRAEEAATLAGLPVRITRRVEEGRVVKHIHMQDGRQYTERVRLFQPTELEAMLTAAGGRVTARYGDDEGRPHTPLSPRVILVATR